ncbi:MAG: SDR family oxidoreductase [Deltaproteobacteria bacterium]|nr:SDR family oxidoreductase [Deltaproteobacteria bacterium]
MNYFVTGATGFIGKYLVKNLLARPEATVYILVRKGSKAKLEGLAKQWWQGASERLVPVSGDITKPKLGVSGPALAKMKGKIDHFFHLAAIYDMTLKDEAIQEQTNVNGTRQAVKLAEAIGAGCFHHVSSIAAAGLYKGVWREDMFEQATNYEQPYFRTKHMSEGVVRKECSIPYRIYRPGIVVGHSTTGEIDKIDGPYYLFKFLQKLRDTIPRWVPLVGLEGSRINIVPVDYVANAMDFLAHKPDLDGRCFHLTDPAPLRVGELMNLFAKAAHSPLFTMRIDAQFFKLIPRWLIQGIASLPPTHRIIDAILADIAVPRHMLSYFYYPTKFDCQDTIKELKGSGIACPALEDYGFRLWDYWERNLDPDLFKDRSLKGAVKDRVILITGASSGIGKATALKVAAAGGKVLLVARTLSHLEETKAEIEEKGGKAFIYPADLSDINSCESLVERVLKEQGSVDILINNAGRSIRRSIALSYNRFHDYERCMQVNFYGALKLILGFLPKMAENQRGHIINISSIGVQVQPPRFSAYVASKSALEAFTRIAQPEFLDKNVYFTIINMPLVRTPMIGPTKFYEHVPTLKADDAAEMICQAIVEKPKRIATRLGIFGQAVNTLLPKVGDIIQNTSYHLFPDSKAASGDKDAKDAVPSAEAVMFATLMRGVHW